MYHDASFISHHPALWFKLSAILKTELAMAQQDWELGEVLTDQRVGDVRPVDAVLQLQLVVGLDVEQEVLVEADSSDQVSPVGALQSAATVDVLHEENDDKRLWNYQKRSTDDFDLTM